MRTDHYLELFCRNIFRIRMERGLTQEQMAGLMGISVNALRKIERGIIPPSLWVESLFLLQKALDIKPSFWFTEE